jgi:hypothetical protein
VNERRPHGHVYAILSEDEILSMLLPHEITPRIPHALYIHGGLYA